MSADVSRRSVIAAVAGSLLLPRQLARGQSASPAVRCDVHCHVFNARDLPIDGFLRRRSPLPDQVDAGLTRWFHRRLVANAPNDEKEKILAILAGRRQVSDDPRHRPLQLAEFLADVDLPGAVKAIIAAWLDDGSEKKVLHRLLDTAALASSYRFAVADELVHTYREVELFTPSLVDYEGWTMDGGPTQIPTATTADEQIELHSLVSLLSMRGLLRSRNARIHPFVAFNPLDKNSLKRVKKAVYGYGFIGVKLYPPCGFLPIGNAALRDFKGTKGKEIDRRLDELYEFCEDEDVPILAHTAPSNGFRTGVERRATPLGWLAVLAEYEDLRINLGHFGHMEGTEYDVQINCLAWSAKIAELMDEHPHVYADVGNSAAVYNRDYRGRFQHWLERLLSNHPNVGQRALYASDWWMDTLDAEHETTYQVFSDMFSQGSLASCRDGFLGKNALAFLGFRKPDGTLDVDNKNRQRLVAFYKWKGVTPPTWLTT